MAEDDRARPDTAAGYMVTPVPTARADLPAAWVIADLSGQRFACADTVFVTQQDGRLEGLVRLRDLFGCGGCSLREIMIRDVTAAQPKTPPGEVANLAIRGDLAAVPVVDAAGCLVGAVPPEAIFRILRDEHIADLAHLAGEGPAAQPVVPQRGRFGIRGWHAAALAGLTLVGLWLLSL